MIRMTRTSVVLLLLSLFFCYVSGAYLQYVSTRLSDPHPNVTLTVGATERVFCLQATGPVPTSIEWYNPQGQLVSKDGGDEVNQQAAGSGRIAHLNFHSYQQSQGGKYECRVAGPGNNSETLPVCIGPTVSPTQSLTEPPSVPSTKTTSEPSTATLSITTLPSSTPPPPPRKVMDVNITSTVTDTSPTLRVTWQALASGAVTYTVKYFTKKGGVNDPPQGALEVREISGTSTILTALKRGTTYYIWVVGVSGGGEGPHSDRTSGKTYDKLPHPTGSSVSVMALNEAGKLKVTWVKPRLEPGQVITGYSVQYKIKGTTEYTNHSVSGSSTTSYTITNLDLGTEYRVRVASIGNLGRSDYCCDGNGKFATTYNYVPQLTDGSVSVVALNESGKVRVTWSKPTLGGQVITGYSVQYRRKGTTSYTTHSVSGSSTTSYTILNLNLGTVYEVRVASVGPLGLSGYCCGSGKEVITYNNVLHPTNGSVSVVALNEAGKIRVTWSRPALGRGQVITGYSVQFKRKGTTSYTTRSVSDSSRTSYTITNLNLGTVYEVRVASVGPLGLSRYCCGRGKEERTYSNVPQPTGASVSVVAINETGKVRVTWSTPITGPGQVITGYSVQYRRRGTTSYTTRSVSGSSTTSYTITNLNLGTVYEVRVASVGRLGLSGYCCGRGKKVTTYSTPGPVRELSYEEITNTSVNITWKSPEETDGDIVSYFVEHGEYQKGPTTSGTILAGGPMYNVIRALEPGVPYNVTVTASTAIGIGKPVSIVVFSVEQAPTAQVSNVKVERVNNNNRAALVSWTPLTLHEARGFPVYFVTYQPNSNVGQMIPVLNTTLNSTNSSVVISGLDLRTAYTISVDVGTGGGRHRSRLGAVNATLKAVPPTTLSIVTSTALPTVLSTMTSTALPTAQSTVTSTALPTAQSTVTSTALSTAQSTVTSTVMSTPQPTAQGTVVPSAGAVVGAVMAAVGLLLLISTAIVVVIAIVVCVKTKAMYFKPDGTRDKNNRQKASPHTPHMQHAQADWKVADNEFIEMSAVQPSIDSQEAPSHQSRPVPKSDFSEHVKAMHKERDSGFEKVYQTMATVLDGVRDIAIANSSKNRYQNIHTYDASRVVLSVPDAVGSDYINASFINGYKQRSAYIASQGPNPETISDFIQMIWDQKPPVVVMLTRLFEKGKPKCERYWLEELNKPLEMPDRGFTMTVTGKKDYADYEVRDMTIKYADDPSAKPLKLKHFFFTAWPDHGVPQHPYSLVKFIQHVRKVVLDSTAPLVVHCSAGVGRTGTFIAVDAMMQRLKEKDDLDIYNFVTQMRTKRTFMVQNMDQYAFIHDALNDYLRCGNTAVAAHNLHVVMTNLWKEDPQTKCSGFEEQFKLLQELSQVPCMVDINFAKKASITKRNRYKDRFPYSTGYVHLPGKAAQEASKTAVNYYNANYVDGYSLPRAFIAAQSPMSHTKGDFWELVCHFRTPTIVLLTNFMEGSQEACATLWPVTEYEASEHYEVTCNGIQPYEGYDVIKLEVVNRTRHDSTPLEVTAFHFKKWPRDGNPETLPLLEMMGKVEKACQKKDKAALVMCDDGMSRTGVFIAAMCEVERVKVEGEVDFFQTIKAMRKQRPHMVYNKEQYTLCFELLQAYLNSFDTYANFKAL